MNNAKYNHRYVFSSLTRIADFPRDIETSKLPLSKWSTGDYVVCEVTNIGGSTVLAELVSGRMMRLMEGDKVIGALGIRHATLEATGTWKAVTEDGRMHILTGAGLMGKMTSQSVFITSLIEVQYAGHVMRDKEKRTMLDYAISPPPGNFSTPVILIVGTSMSSGKTTSARIIARQLKLMGLKVNCAKLTGAGRYRDILSVKDAGADHIIDFVDAGLPSSICSEHDYDLALSKMLNAIANAKPDVSIVEIGASPLEPYNGELAIRRIKEHVKCTILCASDPYAVLGVMQSFQLKPTIVSGPAVNTYAGEELIEKLCQVKALNLIDSQNLPALNKILKERLNLKI